MNSLQKALKNNALFSILSGLILVVLNQQISALFGTSNTTVFWSVGLVLIYFAFTIWYEIKAQRKLAVIWIIIQDYTWVLGSAILILLNPFKITLIGNLIIGIIALIVLYMAINQTIALKNTNN
ncbi:hypothetical protein [uncultured Lacinutrix sp.]|uniref:hypothetical protein n=1 Tax=uncultured Lacinutrix sp. TaxID=574032 RepID=UPI00261C1FB2|nr:hypothetical protein [uncultured Lacinutrix sp.]